MNRQLWRRTRLKNIHPEIGFAFFADTFRPELSSDKHPSPAWVLENGVPLPGRADVEHGTIRELGTGCFNFWRDKVYFSTSDNSDPRTNGRIYEIVYPLGSNAILGTLGRLMPNMGIQVFPELDARYGETLKKDVIYAVQVAKGYLTLIPEGWPGFSGKDILEIGPGRNHGCALLLACLGARVSVSDPYLAAWSSLYHPQFYDLLLDWLAENMPTVDLSPLRQIGITRQYDPHVIRRHASPVETLEGFEDNSFDLVFSCAVLEHTYHPEAAATNLARVSRRGARARHSIDFGYHKTRDKPLDFLLTDDISFARVFAECRGECGNRYRPSEYLHCFRAAGFKADFTATQFAEPGYLNGLVSRLRQAEGTKYQHADISDVGVLSGTLELIKQ